MLIVTPDNGIYHVEPRVGSDTDSTVRICIGRSSQTYDLMGVNDLISILNEAKKELEEGYNAVPRTRWKNSDGEI